MKRPKRITKEFVKNFIEADGYWLDDYSFDPTGMLIIRCKGRWPWRKKNEGYDRIYRFDPRSMAIEVMGSTYWRLRYLSRNSEEYKGVMLFILERKLDGDIQ